MRAPEMKTQSPSGSRGRAGVRISNLPPWLSLLCTVIYIAAGDGNQGTAGARESAGDSKTGVGPRKKPTSRERDGGALRAAKAEAQTEASRALIGVDMGPGVNRAMSPVHRSLNRFHACIVAKVASMQA